MDPPAPNAIPIPPTLDPECSPPTNQSTPVKLSANQGVAIPQASSGGNNMRNQYQIPATIVTRTVATSPLVMIPNEPHTLPLPNAASSRSLSLSHGVSFSRLTHALPVCVVPQLL
jgi:hypothetical protein